MLIESEAAPECLLFSWRRRTKAEIDRQAEKLYAVGRHTAAQRDFARSFRGRDHEVGLAERPSTMKIDQVGDHGHERAGPAALADRLVRDVVKQRVDRQDNVGVVLLQELRHDPPHGRSEHGADGGEGGPCIARVVDRSPRRARAPDHRRIERGQPADDDRPLPD